MKEGALRPEAHQQAAGSGELMIGRKTGLYSTNASGFLFLAWQNCCPSQPRNLCINFALSKSPSPSMLKSDTHPILAH
jgi:hypothetical protein